MCVKMFSTFKFSKWTAEQMQPNDQNERQMKGIVYCEVASAVKWAQLEAKVSAGGDRSGAVDSVIVFTFWKSKWEEAK